MNTSQFNIKAPKKLPEAMKKSQFKKGESGNPKGKTKLPAHVKEALKLNRVDFEHKLHRYLQMPMKKVIAILQDHDEYCIDGMVASIIIKAITEGCVIRTKFLLDRIGIAGYQELSDPSLKVQTVEENKPQVTNEESRAPFYVVEINEDGKFLRARPRQLSLEEKTIDIDIDLENAKNG
jgi:hypothetical protein